MNSPKPFLLIACCCFVSSLFAQLTYHELSVQYDSAWTFKNLKLIPIRYKDSGIAKPTAVQNGNVISFEEAFRTGKIHVKEITAPMGSDIGVLEIINDSKKSILIHSGDIITGGKQNRAAAETRLIPAGNDKSYLQVFCVEKERWDDKSKPFTYGGMADASLRREIDVQQKQNKVWKEIDSQFAQRKVQSLTFNYVNLYKDSAGIDSAYLTFFRNKMAATDSSFAGFVAISGTRVINCELFGSAQLCLISYPNLIKSYVKSISPKIDLPAVEDGEVKNFLDKFLINENQQQQYVSTHGRIYKASNFIIHLVVYGE
jgi:hypothetical protein